MRVAKACCMTFTASTTPEQRSWSRTIADEKMAGFCCLFGLMHRIK